MHTTSFGAAVASLNAFVQDAMEEEITLGIVAKTKFPYWYSSALRHYLTKKNYRRFKKRKSDYLLS
jgi:hypothetical protein